MGLKGLEFLREDIDTIDDRIVELLERRLQISEDVARFKLDRGLEIFDGKREKEVLIRNTGKAGNPNNRKALGGILQTIMDASKDRQREVIHLESLDKTPQVEEKKAPFSGRIGFQGVCGSFGEQAMIKFFGHGEEIESFESFGDLVQAIVDGTVDYGVLPVENSSTGSINDAYDLLREHRVYVVGEEMLGIQQNLLGVEGATLEGIRKVYSHEQGFRQSVDFFGENPQMELIPCRNTAGGAKLVKEQGDPSVAAVASLRAAEIYGLKVLREGLNRSRMNTTRFFILGREPEYEESADKISLMLTVAHKPGALHSVLQIFSDNNLNLMKIESRPIQERPWEYFFYIDIEGNLEDPQTKRMINEVENRCTYFRILGNYRNSISKTGVSI